MHPGKLQRSSPSLPSLLYFSKAGAPSNLEDIDLGPSEELQGLWEPLNIVYVVCVRAPAIFWGQGSPFFLLDFQGTPQKDKDPLTGPRLILCRLHRYKQGKLEGWRHSCGMEVRAQHGTLEAAITAAVAATFKPRFPKCTRAS